MTQQTASEILLKHEDANEHHFYEVDRKWIIEAMEEYASLRVLESFKSVTITPPDLMSDKIPNYPLHEFVSYEEGTTTATKCKICGLESWQHYKINFKNV